MVYEDQALRIDLWRREVSAGGRPVALTPTEYRLLLSLVRRRGQVVAHEQLLAEVWGEDSDAVASLKTYIGSLRRKLEVGSAPRLIHICWGVGYRYDPAPGREERAASGGHHAT